MNTAFSTILPSVLCLCQPSIPVRSSLTAGKPELLLDTGNRELMQNCMGQTLRYLGTPLWYSRETLVHYSSLRLPEFLLRMEVQR